MKFMFSSALALLSVQSVLCTALTGVASGDLTACPFVTPINNGVVLPSSLSNCILDKFVITVSANAADPTAAQANFNLFQRVGPNGRKFLYIQLLPPTTPGGFPQPTNNVQVSISVNPNYTVNPPYVPLIYTVLSTVGGTTFAQTSPTQFVYTFASPANYLSAVLTIAELGYVNAATYSLAGTALTANFTSDIFKKNPFTGTIATFTSSTTPTAFTLPTNKQSILSRLRRHIKKSAVSACVPESQVRKMAVAAFVNEIGSCFRCKEPCAKTICDSNVYVEYITFITCCIKTIAYCEQVKAPKVEFCVSGISSCAVVNSEICRYSRSCNVEVGVNVEICSMFSDMYSGECYEPVCDYVCPVVEPESSSVCEEEISSSSSEEVMKKKVPAKRRAAVKAKTTTTVSTYGWYVAGGIVAVSVAVVVYIFVL